MGQARLTTKQLLAKLREAVQYGEGAIIEHAPNPYSLNRKRRYLSALFPHVQSHAKSVAILIGQNQPRSAALQLRTIQELWIATHFVYSHRSDVWLWQLTLEDEWNNIKKMQHLAFEQELIDKKTREYNRNLRHATRRYGHLPVVGGVINETRRSFERNVNLFERCQIIDAARSPSGSTSGTFVSNYRHVYSHLSETVHGSSRGISSAYVEDSENITLDIYGTSDDLDRIVTFSTYLYYCDVLRYYHSKVLKGVTLPSHIEESYQEVARDVSREMR